MYLKNAKAHNYFKQITEQVQKCTMFGCWSCNILSMKTFLRCLWFEKGHFDVCGLDKEILLRL